MKRIYVTINNREYQIDLGDGESVGIGGKIIFPNVQRSSDAMFSVLLNGVSYTVVAEKNAGGYHLLVNGKQLFAQVESERARLLKRFAQHGSSSAKKLEIKAPMPALVVKVEVAIGDEVVPGQGLVVLEAMKMENEIKTHTAGKVKEINVKKGTPVEKGQLLIRLE